MAVITGTAGGGNGGGGGGAGSYGPNRDDYYGELTKLAQALASGNYAYGGRDGALQDLYQRFGIPAGISFQEVQSNINDMYDTYFPRTAGPVLPGEDQERFWATGNRVETGESTATPTEGTINPATGLPYTQSDYDLARSNYELERAEKLRERDKITSDFEDAYYNINQQRKGLDRSRDEGYLGNQQFFGSVSPDAYQSQVQNYNQKVLDSFNENKNTLDRNKQRVFEANNRFNESINQVLGNMKSNYESNLGQFDRGNAAYSVVAPEYQLDSMSGAAPHRSSAASQANPARSSAIGAAIAGSLGFELDDKEREAVNYWYR